MKQIIYIYIGLCLSISQTILYSLFDGKTQDLTVLSKLKAVSGGSEFKRTSCDELVFCTMTVRERWNRVIQMKL